MKKHFGKLAAAALAATIVGGGFSINASASELETNAINTHEISEVSASTYAATAQENYITLSLGAGARFSQSGITMVLSSGSNTNVVQITNGATVSELKPIGYGTATVKFYSKATGELLSFNYITVIK